MRKAAVRPSVGLLNVRLATCPCGSLQSTVGVFDSVAVGAVSVSVRTALGGARVREGDTVGNAVGNGVFVPIATGV